MASISIENLLREMVDKKASDLHLTVGAPPVWRVDGDIVFSTYPRLTPDSVKALVYSVLNDELEIMGTDTRRQTNLDGLIRLPANEQLEVLKYLKPKIIETGHIAATTKESIIEKIFTLGEKFVRTTKKECPPGIIGPFALQGAIAADRGKEEMVVFDVSMRIPGSPLTRFTPHSGYLYGESISYGERIAMEIKQAVETDRLKEIVT